MGKRGDDVSGWIGARMPLRLCLWFRVISAVKAMR